MTGSLRWQLINQMLHRAEVTAVPEQAAAVWTFTKGEVEDLILDDSLTIGAFVVETDDVLGLSGKTYLVDVDDVQVSTVTEHGEKEYRVTVDASPKQLDAYPEYSHSWWDNVRAQAGKAWTHTPNAAQDAWSRITDAAGDLVN